MSQNHLALDFPIKAAPASAKALTEGLPPARSAHRWPGAARRQQQFSPANSSRSALWAGL